MPDLTLNEYRDFGRKELEKKLEYESNKICEHRSPEKSEEETSILYKIKILFRFSKLIFGRYS